MTVTTSAPAKPIAPPVEPDLAPATQLRVGGMTCGACAQRIERTFGAIRGITASVNYATGVASIRHPESVKDDVLVAVLEDLGYTAAPLDPAPSKPAGTLTRFVRWLLRRPAPDQARVSVTVADGVDPDDALAVAGAVEAGSDHPLAVVIADHAATAVPFWPAMFEIETFDGGRSGDTGARIVQIGGVEALAERGVTLPASLASAVEKMGDDRVPVVLAWGEHGTEPEARAVLAVRR